MIDCPPCQHPYEGWFVDGVPLTERGFLLSEFLETTPSRRGDDIVVARRAGSRFEQKYYESRVQTLVVWALKEDDIGQLKGGNLRNVDRLKTLFGSGLKTVEVTRRITLPAGRVSTRTATVELVSALNGERTVLTKQGVYTSFAVDLLFHDPFWREPENLVTGQDSTYGPAILWNPGTVTHNDVRVKIHGPAVEPEIEFEPAGTALKYDATIAPGDFVLIDAYNFTAVDQSGTSVAGNLLRQQTEFFQVANGRNEVTVSDGVFDVSWKPAFL